MATSVLDALKGINAYPIPLRTIVETAEKRGLDVQSEASQDVLDGAPYQLAMADLLFWLAFAPDVSQGGQSYSFTDEQRLQMRNRARKIWSELEDEAEGDNAGIYGYKGNRL